MVKADAKLVPSLCSWCSPSRRQPGRGDREGAGVELVRPGVAVPRRPAASEHPDHRAPEGSNRHRSRCK